MRIRLFTAIVAILILAAPTWAGITKGPYLQSATDQGIIVGLETDAEVLVTVEVGLDDTYGLEFTTDPEAFTYEGATTYHYLVPVDGLNADTLFHYRVTAGVETTPDSTFSTNPDSLVPFRFAVIGDTRGGSVASPNIEHEAVVAAVLDKAPEFYLNTGDMIANGIGLDDWEYFFAAEAELMATTPVYPVIGNHEMGEAAGITGLGMFGRLFETPNNGGMDTYYSFDYANVQVIVLDLENWWSIVIPGILQHEWLEAELQRFAANPKTNFCFVSFHQPPFSYKNGRMGHIVAQLWVQPLLKKYGVAAAFEGHDHFYARHNMGGVDHIVAGGGGAPLYDFQTFPLPETLPGYRMHDHSNHYLIVDVAETQVDITAYRLDGTIIETYAYIADPPYWGDDDDDDDDNDDDDNDDDDDTAIDDDTADDDTPPADDDDVVPDDDDDDVAAADDDDDDDDSGGCGC
jgi:Calcineurin-like phosphoesterase